MISYFTARSRGGRHDHPAGGTYRFAGRSEPPPLLKKIEKNNSLPLYKPDLKQLEREDPPFARVQEERCSIREYSDKPISERQLGEFLYRVARIDDYVKLPIQSPNGSLDLEFAMRPYPAAGGVYEQELYVVINRCENLESGFHYYDPAKHRLVRISDITSSVETLLGDASRATTIPVDRMQIMFIIAARFQRVAWKYSTIAYASI